MNLTSPRRPFEKKGQDNASHIGEPGFVRKATGLKKGVVSILLFAVVTVRESLAVNSDEPIAKSTHRQNDQEKPRGIEPATNELPQEMTSARQVCPSRAMTRADTKRPRLFYRKAMALSETALGTDDPKTASIAEQSGFGCAVSSPVRRSGSALSERRWKFIRRRLGSPAPRGSRGASQSGRGCRHQGRFAEANALYDQALEIREARQEHDDPEMAPVI